MPSTPQTTEMKTGTVTDSLSHQTPIEASGSLELSDSEERLIRAQQHLNDVRELHRELNRNDPDEDSLRIVQNTLSEAGILLELAEYDDTEEVKNAIARIERFLASKENSSDGEALFAKRELAFRAIDSAARTNPMHHL